MHPTRLGHASRCVTFFLTDTFFYLAKEKLSVRLKMIKDRKSYGRCHPEYSEELGGEQGDVN